MDGPAGRGHGDSLTRYRPPSGGRHLLNSFVRPVVSGQKKKRRPKAPLYWREAYSAATLAIGLFGCVVQLA